MAVTLSQLPLQSQSIHGLRNAHPVCCKASVPVSRPVSFGNRRGFLFIMTVAPSMVAMESASLAEKIPLFGLRKKLKKAEEATEELVKEGFESAEKGLETAEKGLETVGRGIGAAEKGLETVEKEVEGAVSFGAVAQAGAVAGAEVVGVLVATSIVNGILGPEAQKS